MDNSTIISFYIFAALLFPLLGCLMLIITAGKSKQASASIATTASFMSFFLSSVVTVLLFKSGYEIKIESPWVMTQLTHVPSIFTINLISSSLMTVVSFISAFLQVYLTSVLKEKESINWTKFYSLILIYHSVSIAVLLSGALIQIYFFTTMLSVIEFMLCSAERKDFESSKNARNIFLINFMADIMLLAASAILMTIAGTTNFGETLESIQSQERQRYYYSINSTLLILFFIAVKAGFFPFNIMHLRKSNESIPTLTFRLVIGHIAIPMFVLVISKNMILALPESYFYLFTIICICSAVLSAFNSLCSEKLTVIAGNMCFASTSILALIIFSDTHRASLFLLYSLLNLAALLIMSASYLTYLMHSPSLWECGGKSRYIRLIIFICAISACFIAGLPPFIGYWRNSAALSTSVNPLTYILLCVAIVILTLSAFRLSSVFIFNKNNDIIHSKPVPWGVSIVIGILGFITILLSAFEIPAAGRILGSFSGKVNAGFSDLTVCTLLTFISALAAFLFYKNKGKEKEKTIYLFIHKIFGLKKLTELKTEVSISDSVIKHKEDEET